MRPGHGTGSIWAVAAAVSIAGIATVPRAPRDRSIDLPPAVGRTRPAAEARADTVSYRSVGRSALFRASRIAAAHRYDAAALNAAAAEGGAERPSLNLRGTVIGYVPVAVFEEKSDRAAIYVVSVGDEVDGHVVVTIGPDTAVVELAGRRWTFAVEAAWE
jgi:hypothetical protein